MPVVYKFTSPSGKSYIGKTIGTMDLRWHQHVCSWQLAKKRGKYEDHPSKFFHALDKYAPELWKKCILFETDDPSLVLIKEQYYIKEYDAVSNGYNIHKGGDAGNRQRGTTKQHSKHISEGRKAWFKTEEGNVWKDKIKCYYDAEGYAAKAQNHLRKHYHNPVTGDHIFVKPNDNIPDGFVVGFGSRKGQKSTQQGWIWCHDPISGKRTHVAKLSDAPVGFVMGYQ